MPWSLYLIWNVWRRLDEEAGEKKALTDEESL